MCVIRCHFDTRLHPSSFLSYLRHASILCDSKCALHLVIKLMTKKIQINSLFPTKTVETDPSMGNRLWGNQLLIVWPAEGRVSWEQSPAGAFRHLHTPHEAKPAMCCITAHRKITNQTWKAIIVKSNVLKWNSLLNLYVFFVEYHFDSSGFMAHIVWYSENMEGKTAQFYAESQTE